MQDMSTPLTLIVSGFARCGTSMIMQALEAGGWTPLRSPARDRMRDQASDEEYRLNPGSVYEPGPAGMAPGFPLPYAGLAIKVLFPPFGRVLDLWAGNYFIICMHRDYEEQRQSYEAGLEPLYTTGRMKPPPKWSREQYEQTWEQVYAMLAQRTDSRVVRWEYAAVVAQPLAHFQCVPGLDAEKAAAVVDPTLYRFRLDRLTAGA